MLTLDDLDPTQATGGSSNTRGFNCYSVAPAHFEQGFAVFGFDFEAGGKKRDFAGHRRRELARSFGFGLSRHAGVGRHPETERRSSPIIGIVDTNAWPCLDSRAADRLSRRDI